MKLISCYVENFGNLSQKNFDFSNLTSYCEHNGFGKTTLASFIKAMFYGLPATRANSKDFDDRQHYYPFNGGKFGGNITIEKDGKIYKIERFFGKKSAVADECAVYCGGTLTDIPDIGRELFGLDENSFMRTIFISSAETEVGATSSINAKLNNFVDATDETNNYDSAMNMLERAKKSYKAARGSNDKISAQNETIIKLKSDIRNIEEISASLGARYSERESIASRISSLELQLKTAAESNTILQKWKTYDAYLADGKAEKVKLTELQSRYPSGLPSSEEINLLNQNIMARQSASDRLEEASFPAVKQERLKELSLIFKDGIPEENDISALQEKVSATVRLDAEINALEKGAEANNERFIKETPEDGAVKTYGEKIVLLREKKNSLKDIPQITAQSQDGTIKRKGKLPLALAISAVIALCAGIGMLFVQTVAAAVLIVAGVALLCGGGFVYFKGQLKRVEESRPSQINANYLGLQAEINALENEIRSFLSRYGYFTDGGAEVDFSNFSRDLEEYRRDVKNREEARARIKEKSEVREKLTSEVKDILVKYSVEYGDLQNGVVRLKTSAEEYKGLCAENKQAEEKSENLKNIISQTGAAAEEILKKYLLSAAGDLTVLIKRLGEDRRELDRLTESCKALAEKAENYKKSNALKERPAGEETDTNELSDSLSALRGRLSVIDRSINDDELIVENLQDRKNSLELAEEQLKEYKEKHRLITLAMEFLEKAERGLKEKYVAPVRDKFLYYSKLLEKTLGEKVTLDKDYKVMFERGGENRSEKHLSAGQKSLCALCLRLALIDNMYSEQPPFIIMDDPFVNLDAEHMSKAVGLLKELSKDRQIIYFCCHESRSV